MTIKPIRDRVLVRRSDLEENAYQGILEIPEVAQERPLGGVVVAVGPGIVNDQGVLVPLAVQKNDKVLIGKFAGCELEIREVPHVIVREGEILGILG